MNPIFVRGNYFSEAGLLVLQNLMGFGPSIRIKPHPALSAELGSVTLWRESLGDGIYRPPGLPIFAGNKDFGRYVGTKLILGTAWRVKRHIGVTAAILIFLPEISLIRVTATTRISARSGLLSGFSSSCNRREQASAS